MSIEYAEPPRIRPTKSKLKYGRLIDAIRSGSGRWVKISFDEVSGKSAQTKATSIWQATHLRGIRVQTTQQGGFLYVRQVGLEQDPLCNASPSVSKGIEMDKETRQ